MRWVLILALAFGLLPAFAGMPDETGANPSQPAVTPAMTSPVILTDNKLVTVIDCGSYYEVVIHGGRETLQVVFNQRGFNPAYKDEIDRYIASRKKWLNAENEAALRSFFSWAIPNGFVETPLKLDSNHYFGIQQTVERLLAQQMYTNKKEIRLRIPKQSLPVPPPLGNVNIQYLPLPTLPGVRDISCPKGPDCPTELKLPECRLPEAEECLVEQAGFGLANPGLRLPTTVHDRWSYTGAFAWWWSPDKIIQRPPEPKPCPPGMAPPDPPVPIDPGGWDPDYPTQPGDIGPHPWEPPVPPV